MGFYFLFINDFFFIKFNFLPFFFHQIAYFWRVDALIPFCFEGYFLLPFCLTIYFSIPLVILYYIIIVIVNWFSLLFEVIFCIYSFFLSCGIHIYIYICKSIYYSCFLNKDSEVVVYLFITITF